MTLEQLVFVVPLLSVTIFFSIEKAVLNRRTRWSKVVPIAVIHGVNLGLSLGLSMTLLMPIVFAIAPFQIFSFSAWQVPVWVSFALSFLFLDCFHYWSHRLHHAIPALWRIHRLHHSDRDVDALTTVLHHPLETITGFLGVIACAVMVDVPVAALMAYSIAMGFHAGFTHLNAALPASVERLLRRIIVTPNFHRPHHSVDEGPGNSNFGAIFVFWDYLFKTALPEHCAAAPAFGISPDQTPRQDSLGAYLENPLK